MSATIESFHFEPGRKVGRRYAVERRLGGGSEGEVYQIREIDTGILRAAKFYFPHRDPTRKLAIRHAQKLNALRQCPIVLQYHHSEVITVRRQKVVAMISDLFDGEPLALWVGRHPHGRLEPYLALHVLYHLVRGLEVIHRLGEYHADVHTENILIQAVGVRFEMRLIDFYDWGKPSPAKRRQDVRDAVHVFYESMGGAKRYKHLPAYARHICAGLRRDRILQRFPTMTALREHLERFDWEL